MKYQVAAVGGTFDHFHVGHQQLLETALNSADKVVIGLTHQDLTLNKPLAQLIETYEIRYQNISQFLNQQGFGNKSQLIELTDAFGPTVSDPQIDSLVVSEMTQAGALLVNQERAHRRLSPLPVIITPMVVDEAGNHISSSEIRAGRITRQGKVFNKLFTQNIVFSPEQLHLLKSPQGISFNPDSLDRATSTVLVGDVVTKYFLDHNLNFNYAIVDGKTKRQPINYSYPQAIKLPFSNPAGSINSELAQHLLSSRSNFPGKTIFEVQGEEDLLAFIPCLTEPLQSLVLYGQPEQGIVMMTLTEELKLRLGQILDPKFK